MTIYVDDAGIPASVRNGSRTHTSTWCHLTADTQEELHAFAAQLGLKQSYFQPGTPLGGKPSPFWHYDLTAGKRAQAVNLGAVQVGYRDMPALMRAREAGRPAEAAAKDTAPRLLFTSSRDGVTEAEVAAALRPLFAPGKVLVAGGARGGDQIAARLWRQWGGQVDERKVSPEAWQRSRGAGYARNAEMVAEVKAKGGEFLAAIAQCASPKCDRGEPHGSHGAVHCAGLAEAEGLPVIRVRAQRQPVGNLERALRSLRSAGMLAPERAAAPGGGASTAAPAPAGACNSPECGQPGHPYAVGIRCDTHKPVPAFRPSSEVPADSGGICPCCSRSRLTAGREMCQGCGAAAAVRPPPRREFADLSHGRPGHMCVLPLQARPEAEAGT
jgi:Protein of unknown function (DUF4031)